MTTGRAASASIVPRPEASKQRQKPRLASSGPRDTPIVDAAEVTHTPGDLPSFLKQAQQAQQQRQYSTGSGVGSYTSVVAAAAARVLGGAGRLPPLSRGLSSWRGFAASLW